jgi:hypothetical protein
MADTRRNEERRKQVNNPIIVNRRAKKKNTNMATAIPEDIMMPIRVLLKPRVSIVVGRMIAFIPIDTEVKKALMVIRIMLIKFFQCNGNLMKVIGLNRG